MSRLQSGMPMRLDWRARWRIVSGGRSRRRDCRLAVGGGWRAECGGAGCSRRRSSHWQRWCRSSRGRRMGWIGGLCSGRSPRWHSALGRSSWRLQRRICRCRACVLRPRGIFLRRAGGSERPQRPLSTETGGLIGYFRASPLWVGSLLWQCGVRWHVAVLVVLRHPASGLVCACFAVLRGTHTVTCWHTWRRATPTHRTPLPWLGCSNTAARLPAPLPHIAHTLCCLPALLVSVWLSGRCFGGRCACRVLLCYVMLACTPPPAVAFGCDAARPWTACWWSPRRASRAETVLS